MHHAITRALAAALFLSVSGTAAWSAKAAKPPAPPKHNYVGLALMPDNPAPPPAGAWRMWVQLIDTDSIRRDGDTLEFDDLELSQVTQFHPTKPGEAPIPSVTTLVPRRLRFSMSCGWRTLRRLPDTDDYGGPEQFRFFESADFLQDEFETASSTFQQVEDKLCAGTRPPAAKGYSSEEAAIAAWKDDFGARPSGPVVMRQPPGPEVLAWMDGHAAHRFVAEAEDAASGNRSFLDWGNLSRDGDMVTALQFTVLGPGAGRYSRERDSVAALRNMQYDCAKGTATVLNQANWDRYGSYFARDDKPFGLRDAKSSPVTAADIAAACKGTAPADNAQSFAATEDAWAFARDHWPVSSGPGWAACLWQNLPADRRAQYKQDWQAQNSSRLQLLGKDERASALQACRVPQGYDRIAQDALDAFGRKEAMQSLLAKANIDEAKLLTAWRALPTYDRQRFTRALHGYTQDDLRFQKALVASLAQTIGADMAMMQAMWNYITAEAALEES